MSEVQLQELSPSLPDPSNLDPIAPPVPERRSSRHLPLTFTGSGGEYFRVWIVNLALSVATLGIYSAWAKVRKLQYFAANTQLDGSSFQFHGRPFAILRGRLLVVAFVVAYSLLGRVSLTAARMFLAAGALLYPWLVTLALRFRLSNTSWQGVRFGFGGATSAAYAALAPGLAAWLVLVLEPPRLFTLWPFSLGQLLFAAVMPLVHARSTAFRVDGTVLGQLRAKLEPAVGAFHGLYGKVLLLGLGGLGLVLFLVAPVFPGRGYLVALYVGPLLVYAVLGSYFYARLQALVWDRIKVPDLRLRNLMSARRVLGLGIKGGLLTVLTVGLYWPWLAVAFHRYKLDCLRIDADAPVDSITAARPVEVTAAGDSAVDMVGWDFGW